MTRISASAVVAREAQTGIRLFSVRRIDSQEDLRSIDNVANRRQARAVAPEASRRVRQGDEAFRTDVVSVRALRAPGGMGGMGGMGGIRTTAIVPSAPEAVADVRTFAGPAFGDPPPPYAPPGCVPEGLPPCAPPSYASCVSCGVVPPGAPSLPDPPPSYSQPSLDWYLREGYPRSDV
ncbi:hypothetical protein [Pandoraea anhela]|uniref:Uncharacterized protein n=1 Tax=Pandoraea anhela TaxID=2508295 RepID=A0A5E4SPL1_9BURK|nr:hypothetical protein [Pandoraea anhela]VVD77640.1 hypothetical protein PAN31108_00941 [Pandoraea anhela]